MVLKVLFVIFILISHKTLEIQNFKANCKVSGKFLNVKDFGIGILEKIFFLRKRSLKGLGFVRSKINPDEVTYFHSFVSEEQNIFSRNFLEVEFKTL